MLRAKILVLSLLMFCTLFVNAQQEGNFRIAVSSEVADLGFDQVNYTGLQWQIFVHRNISLNYNYSLGWDEEGRLIFHFPVLVSSIVWLEDLGEAGILALFAPEGVSYHNYPADILEVELYCNPLCSDYNIHGNEMATVTCSMGIKPHLKFSESFSVAPNLGIKFLYGTGEIKQMTGLSLELMF